MDQYRFMVEAMQKEERIRAQHRANSQRQRAISRTRRMGSLPPREMRVNAMKQRMAEKSALPPIPTAWLAIGGSARAGDGGLAMPRRPGDDVKCVAPPGFGGPARRSGNEVDLSARRPLTPEDLNSTTATSASASTTASTSTSSTLCSKCGTCLDGQQQCPEARTRVRTAGKRRTQERHWGHNSLLSSREEYMADRQGLQALSLRGLSTYS